MKYLISILFFAFTVNTFAASEVEQLSLVEDFSIELVKIEKDNVEIEKLNTLNNQAVAFECIYTVEWLYKECPFIERIVAIA